MDYMITTEHLTKKYKNFVSVNQVSLHIRKGSIYGFLGPNGAGKSTTMKMLLGLTAPTKGSFSIDGKHFPEDRMDILKEIGSFIEAPSFYANLTGRENLDVIKYPETSEGERGGCAGISWAYGIWRQAGKEIFSGNETAFRACWGASWEAAYPDPG